MTLGTRKRVGILISGRGSNMTALINAASERDYPAEIVGVFSNKVDAAGLEFARAKGIATHAQSHKEFASREAFDDVIDTTLTQWGVDFVCLAGFMRIFSTSFAEKWSGRMLNIHPSLLPLFKGLHPHRQALQAGVRIHGATVHFVTPDLDGGPIVAQSAIPAYAHDSEDDLAARVLKVEHSLYPMALRHVALGDIRYVNGASVYSDAFVAAGETTPILTSPPEPQRGADLEQLARITP